MSASDAVELRAVLITDIVLDVRCPSVSDEDKRFGIDVESTWSLSSDGKMYVSLPAYTFEVAREKTDEKLLTASISYFCAAAPVREVPEGVDDEVAAELHQCTDSVINHHFVKDLNDLLLRAGYPPIHFSRVTEALEETE